MSCIFPPCPKKYTDTTMTGIHQQQCNGYLVPTDLPGPCIKWTCTACNYGF